MAGILLVAFLPLLASPAAGQSAANREAWRIRELPAATIPATPSPLLPRAQLGSTGRFGFGMFGLKNERQLRPVTVDETTAPKSRRPGVGFSLKF